MSVDEEEHVTGRSIRSVRFFRKARSKSRLRRGMLPFLCAQQNLSIARAFGHICEDCQAVCYASEKL